MLTSGGMEAVAHSEERTRTTSVQPGQMLLKVIQPTAPKTALLSLKKLPLPLIKEMIKQLTSVSLLIYLYHNL